MLLRRLRARLTYANVMATIAVFLALGGGAYAITVPRASVGTEQLKRKAVTGSKVASSAVSGRKIKRNAVTSSKVRNGSIGRADLASGVLTSGPRGTEGPTGPRGLTGPRGPSELLFDDNSSGGGVSSTSYANNRNYSIPAGQWWLVWSGQVDTASVPLDVTCRLSVSNVPLDEKTVHLASTAHEHSLVLQGVVTGPVDVNHQCKVSAAGSAAVRFFRFHAVTADTVTDLAP